MAPKFKKFRIKRKKKKTQKAKSQKLIAILWAVVRRKAEDNGEQDVHCGSMLRVLDDAGEAAEEERQQVDVRRL